MTTNCDIYVIVAMTAKRIIGNNNKIPWHIPEDLKAFKEITSGNIVVMGRKTFESIGKPLPNRHNIIISNTLISINGAEVYKTFGDGIRRARELGKKIFCIGGEEIYKSAILEAKYLYISWIKDEYVGDTQFPEFDLSEWKLVENKNYSNFELSFYHKIGFNKSSKEMLESGL